MSVVQELPHVRLVSSRPSDRSVEREALLAARGDANILIIGDRGPGKAALARFIHEQSDRSLDGFSIVNCGRLSDELIRFQLFGHREDAAADAGIETRGLLTSNFSGTVFLDDVGSLGAATQARLLRYLEAHDTKQPVRFIASTTANLNANVLAGMFLLDLYERLNERTLVVQGSSTGAMVAAPARFGGQTRLRQASQRSWNWLTALRSSSSS